MYNLEGFSTEYLSDYLLLEIQNSYITLRIGPSITTTLEAPTELAGGCYTTPLEHSCSVAKPETLENPSDYPLGRHL